MPISGKNGTVYWGGAQEANVTNISSEEITELHAYATNETSGRKKRIAGLGDWTGTFELLDKPSFETGDSATLAIYDDADTWSGPVKIGRIGTSINPTTGEPVGFTVAFEGDGALTKATGSAP